MKTELIFLPKKRSAQILDYPLKRLGDLHVKYLGAKPLSFSFLSFSVFLFKKQIMGKYNCMRFSSYPRDFVFSLKNELQSPRNCLLWRSNSYKSLSPTYHTYLPPNEQGIIHSALKHT